MTTVLSSPAEDALVQQIAAVRRMIVQIEVVSHGTVPSSTARLCPFNDAGKCVVGTGFFVSKQTGTVTTACHVTRAVKDILDDLSRNHVAGDLYIGWAMPNMEVPGAVVTTAGFKRFKAAIKEESRAHDLATIEPQVNPFTNHVEYKIGDRIVSRSPICATLTADRPYDGQSVLACGYPLGSGDLVSTSGRVASAWILRPTSLATSLGITDLTNMTEVDLRVNPGNSGGPLFRSIDNAVVGVVVEVTSSQVSTGGLAYAVSARHLIDFLKDRNIPACAVVAEPPKIRID
jgi:hypothetical protein